MSTYLSVDRISKRYKTTLAVDGLSFTVQSGRIFAFLGPNGAGKSTSVRMLLGLTRPDSGTIRYHNIPAGERPLAQAVGYLPEERGLYIDQTVIDNLVYLSRLRGLARKTATTRAREWLERFDLADRGKEKIEALSKGNQQKVQLIAAVMHEPEVLFLDEPFSGLDPINQEKMLNLLRDLRNKGITILLSAHQMELVERLADDLLLMSQGRSVLQGSLAQILADQARGTRLLLGLDQPADLQDISARDGVIGVEQEDDSLSLLLNSSVNLNDLLGYLSADLKINSIHTERPSLHDVYVEAVVQATADDSAARARHGEANNGADLLG